MSDGSFRSTKVTMMLADFAKEGNGKLDVMGGGWTITGPAPAAYFIAMLIEMPWEEAAGVQHVARLELIDSEGNPVVVDTPNGVEPVQIRAEFGMTPAPGIKKGTPLVMPAPIPVPPYAIPPGGRYEWRLEVDGMTHEDWRIGFNTRPEVQSNAA